MDIDLLLIAERLLQLDQGYVALLLRLAFEQLKLLLRQTGRLTSAVRQRGQIACVAPLVEQFVDEGDADAELLGDFRDCTLPLLIGSDDPLAQV